MGLIFSTIAMARGGVTQELLKRMYQRRGILIAVVAIITLVLMVISIKRGTAGHVYILIYSLKIVTDIVTALLMFYTGVTLNVTSAFICIGAVICRDGFGVYEIIATIISAQKYGWNTDEVIIIVLNCIVCPLYLFMTVQGYRLVKKMRLVESLAPQMMSPQGTPMGPPLLAGQGNPQMTYPNAYPAGRPVTGVPVPNPILTAPVLNTDSSSDHHRY